MASPMTTTRSTRSIFGSRQSCALTLALILAAVPRLFPGMAAAQSPAGACPAVGQISIVVSNLGSAESGSAQIKIQATLPGATAGAVVLLQGKSSLEAGTPWLTIEPLTLQSNSVE